MTPPGHIIASGVISVLVWAYFKSFGCAAASFAAGVLIDIDHILDYCVNIGFTLNARSVYDACLDMRLEKLYILFHSYELVALFWLAIYIFSLSALWQAVAIGFTQHIILDRLTNPMKAHGYFLTYRIMNKFKTDSLLNR